MKNPIRTIAIAITIPCVTLSFVYIVLLMLSPIITLPIQVEDNVLFTDWFFLSVPVLALASAILLQVSSLRRKKKSAK